MLLSSVDAGIATGEVAKSAVTLQLLHRVPVILADGIPRLHARGPKAEKLLHHDKLRSMGRQFGPLLFLSCFCGLKSMGPCWYMLYSGYIRIPD